MLTLAASLAGILALAPGEDGAGVPAGTLELGLGAFALAGAAGLIGFGAASAVQTSRRQAFCENPESASLDNSGVCQLDPPALGWAAAGLGFGLSVPVAVGGALLLRRGLRERRAERIDPTGLKIRADRRSTFVSWRLRF